MSEQPGEHPQKYHKNITKTPQTIPQKYAKNNKQCKKEMLN